ncbi:MAG TPA: cyclic nucleotide-binding domain-containing protein [Candidatus Desulfobacillus sp.]|nr:cyclic nucleotide-binding domain-containing protein [Candidatus Desulfobacillus sp.]
MLSGSSVTIDALRSLPVFESLPVERLMPIARVAVFRKVPRGATILRAGDRTDFVYFILSGGLKVLVSDEEGREVIFSNLGPGEFFGEMGVLDDNPRSATVISTTPCELIVIAKSDFKRCLAENFDVSLYIMRSLVKRLRNADRKIESLALVDVFGRVARLLLEMAEEDGEGQRVVTRKISRQDIAKMVGASREMVSRVMKDLQLQGLIEEDGGRILLRDKLRFA